jgi:chorismate--pyruvate lyase
MKTTWKKNLLAGRVPSDLSAWLSHKGSFMQRLKKYGVNTAVIHVLNQSWQYPTPEESEVLKIKPRQLALVREVLIESPASAKWMVARTVLPRATITGKEQQLARLKNRSLGSVLFKDPRLQRGEFELSCLRRGSAWYQKIVTLLALEAEEFWARRSVFTLNQKSLLLTEIFSPDVAALKNVNA